MLHCVMHAIVLNSFSSVLLIPSMAADSLSLSNSSAVVCRSSILYSISTSFIICNLILSNIFLSQVEWDRNKPCVYSRIHNQVKLIVAPTSKWTLYYFQMMSTFLWAQVYTFRKTICMYSRIPGYGSIFLCSYFMTGVRVVCFSPHMVGSGPAWGRWSGKRGSCPHRLDSIDVCEDARMAC